MVKTSQNSHKKKKKNGTQKTKTKKRLFVRATVNEARRRTAACMYVPTLADVFPSQNLAFQIQNAVHHVGFVGRTSGIFTRRRGFGFLSHVGGVASYEKFNRSVDNKSDEYSSIERTLQTKDARLLNTTTGHRCAATTLSREQCDAFATGTTTIFTTVIAVTYTSASLVRPIVVDKTRTPFENHWSHVIGHSLLFSWTFLEYLSRTEFFFRFQSISRWPPVTAVAVVGRPRASYGDISPRVFYAKFKIVDPDLLQTFRPRRVHFSLPV